MADFKAIETYLQEHLDESITELSRLAAQPSVGAQNLGLKECAALVADMLKARGFESPYLKAFVVARINHLRFVKEKHPDFDASIERILGAAKRFNVANIRPDQIARSGGAPEES